MSHQPVKRILLYSLILFFKEILITAGLIVTVRRTRGDDIDAACGQLAGEVKDRTKLSERMAQKKMIAIKETRA